MLWMQGASDTGSGVSATVQTLVLFAVGTRISLLFMHRVTGAEEKDS